MQKVKEIEIERDWDGSLHGKPKRMHIAQSCNVSGGSSISIAKKDAYARFEFAFIRNWRMFALSPYNHFFLLLFFLLRKTKGCCSLFCRRKIFAHFEEVCVCMCAYFRFWWIYYYCVVALFLQRIVRSLLQFSLNSKQQIEMFSFSGKKECGYRIKCK